MDVGKLTEKPIANARIHLSKKSGTKPKFVKVRTKDIEKDIPSDIKAPNKIVEYFLPIFTTTIIPIIKLQEINKINIKSTLLYKVKSSSAGVS